MTQRPVDRQCVWSTVNCEKKHVCIRNLRNARNCFLNIKIQCRLRMLNSFCIFMLIQHCNSGFVYYIIISCPKYYFKVNSQALKLVLWHYRYLYNITSTSRFNGFIKIDQCIGNMNIILWCRVGITDLVLYFCFTCVATSVAKYSKKRKKLFHC